MNYYCYILFNKSRTMPYVGYTNNIERRIRQHKKGNGAVYTKKYNVTVLIYFESFTEMKLAKAREMQLKKWHKDWKWNLIKEDNPYLLEIDV